MYKPFSFPWMFSIKNWFWLFLPEFVTIKGSVLHTPGDVLVGRGAFSLVSNLKKYWFLMNFRLSYSLLIFWTSYAPESDFHRPTVIGLGALKWEFELYPNKKKTLTCKNSAGKTNTKFCSIIIQLRKVRLHDKF